MVKRRFKGMETSYIWQAEYGKRTHLISIFKQLLKEQDASSLEMLAIFVNNNPYNLEFFVALFYDVPQQNHIEKMIELFEKADLILRNDLTALLLIQEMRSRRFNSCIFCKAEDVDRQFELMFFWPEISVLEGSGYCMRPFGKSKQVFISHSSKDKKDVEKIIPYLNGQDLPVWFDKCSISVGNSIIESVQAGIEESDMVIFWVTDNFLSSNWCRFEMRAYIKRLIEEEIQMIIVLADEIETKRLPLFLQDIKYIRIDNRTVIQVAEELAKIVKQNR